MRLAMISSESWARPASRSARLSREALAERLAGRAQDSDEVIARRMRDAVAEMSHFSEFDYLVINDTFEVALADRLNIIRCRRLRQQRQNVLHRELIASLLV